MTTPEHPTKLTPIERVLRATPVLTREQSEAILRQLCENGQRLHFDHNPDHAIGTCADCGEEMTYNVPRMGPNGGFIHKATGQLLCQQQ